VRPQCLIGRLELEAPPLQVAQRRRSFDEDVAQRPHARRLRPQDVASQTTVARAGLHHDERIRLAERAPAPVEITRYARTEERSDFRAREEVAARPARAPTGREEPTLA